MGADADALLQILGAQLERWTVPGLQLVFVRDGAVVFAGGVGVRGVDDSTPVASSTLFQHGSCGKAYTGLLASLVARDGDLDLDAPVRRYLPEFRLPDAVIAERVTTRDLLSHRSGLGRHDLAWIFNETWDRRELMRRVEHLPLHADLRAEWSYSNFGFSIAGLVVEAATGRSWEDGIRTRIFEPLGMTRATVYKRDLAQDPDSATPHVVRDGKPVVTAVREMQATAPAGGVAASADDAARWLLTQLGDGPLPADVVRSCHELQVPIPSRAMPLPEISLHGYGLGWIEGSYRGRPIAWHSGGVDGFLTQTLLLPEQRAGVLVCANAHMSGLPLAAVLHVADVVLGEVGDPSWFDRMHPDTAQKQTGEEKPAEEHAPEPPPAAATPRPPVHPLTSYAGSYTNAGYGVLTVRVDKAHELGWRFGDADLVGSHRHLDTWDLHYLPLDTDLTATFNTGVDGTVAEVIVGFEAEAAPIVFRRQQAD